MIMICSISLDLNIISTDTSDHIKELLKIHNSFYLHLSCVLVFM